ncbi:MAG TPA: phage GP46 family protein [Hyphomicrobiales bacterium]|nr:phage GP46 family protein [Hyphomicrobiales bacterium]
MWSTEEGRGDWAMAGADEADNIGGLRATAALETAVVLCLFTDRRCPADHPLAWLADGDRRGWWGDAVDVRADLGEAPLGSLLWLLERAPLDGETAMWAEAFAIEALQPLVDQKAVSKIEAVATARPEEDRLDLVVRLYGRDGSLVYDRKFDNIWAQVGR